MFEPLQLYIKELYLKNQVDAKRFKELKEATEAIRRAPNAVEEYQLLFEMAGGDYPELHGFLLLDHVRASEDLEAIMIQKIDELVAEKELDKANLMLDLMERMQFAEVEGA